MYRKYIELLQQMIAIPSFSREEEAVADLIEKFLVGEGCTPVRIGNNILVGSNLGGGDGRPLLLLNSHIDTVRPVDSWSRDPFNPEIIDGRLYGLGSNDAGASVVALIAAFLELRKEQQQETSEANALNVNLMLALSCEEECSGAGGMKQLFPYLTRNAEFSGGADMIVEGELPVPDMAIVGEPTAMQAAVGERGLVVLDCVSRGRSGHAARNEGINAVDIAVEDINRLHGLRLPVSELLGETKFSVTQINAGYRHNVIPDECRWVVDIRTTDALSNEEVVEAIRKELRSDVTPRSTNLRASALAPDHPLVKAAETVGARPFNSPTMSDMALMPIPSLKIGPGESARSHSADEYIRISEIEDAIDKYIKIIKAL